MKQRLAIGQVVIFKPDYLVLDEPASGLDPEARLSLSKLFIQLKEEGMITDFSSIGSLVSSKRTQQAHIDKWNQFWSPARRDSMQAQLIRSGLEIGFKPQTYDNFYQHLSKDFSPIELDDFKALSAIKFEDFVAEKNGLVTMTSLVSVDRSHLNEVRELFKGKANILTIDRQQMKESFLGGLKEDFNGLISISLFIVILILLLYFRSISLTLVTGIPIVLTWLLTIGVMGMFGLELNIFNIIICTFIFGLGIDYSVFITKGLLHELKTGEKELKTYRTSIILSVITTLLGVGVLVFAQHPALHSISLLSIIGILSAVFVAFAIQPWLFRCLIGSAEHRPVSLRMFVHSFISFVYFGLGGLVLSLISSVILPIIPAKKETKLKYMHRVISAFKRSVLYSNPFVKKQIQNPGNVDFNKPAIIIANHTSFLDILALGTLHPDIVFLVNDWVYNSPIFGRIVRMVGAYPVSSGLDDGLEHLKSKIDQGYSIAIFPEGTRSMTHEIKRFHKGAFYLAQSFNLDIIPVILHGNAQVLPKGAFAIRDGVMTMKVLPRITPGSEDYGTDHRTASKKIKALFCHEHQTLREEIETPDFFYNEVLDEYRYRAPSRYRELKKLLSSHAQELHQFTKSLPSKAHILHIGLASSYLDFLLITEEPGRKIKVLLMDPEEISLVKNSAIKSRYGRIEILHDLEEAASTQADVLIIDRQVVGLDPKIDQIVSSYTEVHYIDSF